MASRIQTGRAASKAKASKATASKAPAKVENPAPAKVETAKPVTVYAHWAMGSTPYKGLSGHLLGGVTAAALIVAGYAKLANGRMAKAGKGNPAIVRALVGDILGEWRTRGRVENGELTAGGLNHLNDRLDGKARTYNTSAPVVEAIVTAMTKGAKVECEGVAPLAFSRKVEIK